MDLTAILLAGERVGASAVAAAARVPCKALAPVGGQTMLERVLGTLAASERVAECCVAGNPEFRSALEPVLTRFSGFACWQDGDTSPARSAARVAAAIPEDRGILLTSADHPLLSAAMISQLCSAPEAQTHDVVAGLVRRTDVMAQYPRARCTALRFADDEYCGTNLFLFPTVGGRRLLTAWQRVEQSRKTPWRVISILGPAAVVSYLAGRLSLSHGLSLLSKRMGMAIAARLLDDPRAALDVDTIGDWEFARELLDSKRGPQA
jgi:CTP:molybdopterin cytidylyltransferase MocA